MRFYVYPMHVSAHRRQKRVSELLELTGITAIVDHLERVLETEPGSPIGAMGALKG